MTTGAIKQEPVAYLMDGELFTSAEYEVIAEQGDGSVPLYATPPQEDWEAVAADQAMTIAMMEKREWVGLTDEDRKNFYQGKYVISDDYLMDAVEAKLKEKNNR